MKLVLLLIFASYMCLVVCRKPSPSTCYSRMLELSKEIMDVLDRLHKHNQTKACAKMLPTIFLDVHNSCMVSKLRDFLYVVENLPSVSCRARPRITLLRRKAQNLFTIINRVCYRDLVYFTDDCEAIDTGIISPRYGGDRLQLLTEN